MAWHFRFGPIRLLWVICRHGRATKGGPLYPKSGQWARVQSMVLMVRMVLVSDFALRGTLDVGV